MSSGDSVAVALAALGGVAGSVQVAVMARVGGRIGTLEALAFSTCVQVVITVSALLVVRQSLAGFGEGLRQPSWMWIGGAMGAFIVFSITLATPRIGAAATIGLIIGGPLIMGAAIDRFGLFGLERIPIGWPRLLGLGLLAAGAVLSLRR